MTDTNDPGPGGLVEHKVDLSGADAAPPLHGEGGGGGRGP